MPDYGLYIRCDFDSSLRPDDPEAPVQSYTIYIKKKDYFGNVITATGGETPFKSLWELDDPRAPIRGMQFTIALVNAGNIPLKSFYSDNDDEYLCEVVCNGVTVAKGFYVQDDCSEELSDVAHEILLSFTDNLGLLKGVDLDEAMNLPDMIIRASFADIIAAIIRATGVELNIAVYNNLQAYGTAQMYEWTETMVALNSYMVNNTDFDNCYNVLEKIMRRFRCCIMQCEGRWNIVRWDEYRYGGLLNGREYDPSFNYIGDIQVTHVRQIGQEQASVFEFGARGYILRGYKRVKETFNYRQPAQLLRNADFLELGPLIRQYIQGDNTVYEYQMKWWDAGLRWSAGGNPTENSGMDRFIRVIKDNATNTEIERYAVGKANAYPEQLAFARSQLVELNRYDKLKISFQYRTTRSQAGPNTNIFAWPLMVNEDLRTENGYFLNTDVPGNYTDTSMIWELENVGTWSYQAAGNTNQWQSVSLETQQLPVDGKFFFQLCNANFGDGFETHYRNITFEVIRAVNQSSLIIGHTHTREKETGPKQNDDTEIFLDDAPSNAIAGAIFLPEMNGAIRRLATSWRRESFVNPPEIRKLGDITTFEQLFWRRIPRTRAEGNVYGLELDAVHLSPLSLLRFTDVYEDLNCIFGTLEVDYRNNMANGTIWEWFYDGEDDDNLLQAEYTFAYIYQNETP